MKLIPFDPLPALPASPDPWQPPPDGAHRVRPAMMPKTLRVQHTVTHQGEALVVFADLPGPDAELRPEQIRRLAGALLRIANDSEAWHAQNQHWPVRLHYTLDFVHDFPPRSDAFDLAPRNTVAS